MSSFPVIRLIFAAAFFSIFYGQTLAASAAPEPPQVAATTISLSTFPNPAEFGQPVSITATVNPSSATGRVTFYDGVTVLGTATLLAGQATLQTSLLASGGSSLHAHYSGDGTHGASNSLATP